MDIEEELDLNLLKITKNGKLINELYHKLKQKGGTYTFTYFQSPNNTINFHKLRFKINGNIKEIFLNIPLSYSLLIDIFGKKNVYVEDRGVKYIQSAHADIETVLRDLLNRDNFYLRNFFIKTE